MRAVSDDIATPRFALRLIGREAIEAVLAGDLERARSLLEARIPGDILAHPSSFAFAKAQLDADPRYEPWSVRAIIASSDQSMVGHIRFHSLPDPDYLRPLARNAVEFGYHVFPEYRRRGCATEASIAAMNWAQSAFGVCRFVVSVSPDNTPSLALITRLGFTRVGCQMDEIDGPEDIYSREIAC